LIRERQQLIATAVPIAGKSVRENDWLPLTKFFDRDVQSIGRNIFHLNPLQVVIGKW
jgi:hypothetical protein